MAYRPPRSACFRPDVYRDLALFADRESECDELVSLLDSFLEPGGPGEACVLLRGQRGVGKSMLARKALDIVKMRLGGIFAEVDCALTGIGLDPVLRSLARTLAEDAVQNSTNESVRNSAQLLARLVATTKIKAREVRSWSEQFKLSLSATSKFYDQLALEFGMVRAAGRSLEVEETFERDVDSSFLLTRIAGFASDCAAADEKLVLFVDNLDQAGYPERREDVEKVTDLARHLFGLRGCVVLMTLRTEFVSRDLQKICSFNQEIPAMTGEGLFKVANARMTRAAPARRQALADAGFERVARTLSDWTGNAWGFLDWLQLLDYAPTGFDGDDPIAVHAALMSAVRPRFPGLHENELRDVARAFVGEPHGYRTREQLLLECKLGQDLIDRAVSYHALVPDWLLEPRGFCLPPQLHFLAANLGHASVS